MNCYLPNQNTLCVQGLSTYEVIYWVYVIETGIGIRAKVIRE